MERLSSADPALAPGLTATTRLCVTLAGLASLLGAVVIFGWITHQPALVQVAPQWAPMQVNTALSFCLTGLGVVALAVRRPRWGVALGAVVTVLGGLTLLEYFAGVDLGLDQLFFDHYITVETSHVGRMSPKTALCFVLMGLALVSRRGRPRPQLTASLASLTLGVGAVVLVSYAVGIDGEYGALSVTRMAVHTASGFVLVSTALLLHEWAQTPQRIPDWAPIPTALAAVAFGLLLWMAFDVQHAAGAGGPSSGGVAILLLVGTMLFAALLTLAVVQALRALRQKDAVQSANSALADANARLAEVNAALSHGNEKLKRFAWVTSHDLQAPLSTMAGFVGLLRRRLGEAPDEGVDRCLTQIEEAAQRMRTLIQDILAYSRLQSAPEYAIVNLEAALASALASLQADIQAADAQVLHPAPLPEIWGHAGQITQVLTNLINNAIKYRGDDAPIVSISVEATADAVVVAIRDNGIGIAPEHHAQIFEAFKRLHGRSRYDGSGIGLAICNEIIRQHRGTLSVASAVGAGSTFTIQLPRPAPEARPDGSRSPDA